MSTALQTAVGTVALNTATETIVATLGAWSPKVDVYVDATANANAADSYWRVYGVVGGLKTLLASQQLPANDIGTGQGVRLLASVDVPLGSTIELHAKAAVGAVASIRGCIVGWDPEFQGGTAIDTGTATTSLTPSAEANLFTLGWHPNVEVAVLGTAAASSSVYRVRAVLPGPFVSKPVVGFGVYQDETGGLSISCQGGASSWQVTGQTSAATGSIMAIGQATSYAGVATGGGTAPGTSYTPTTPGDWPVVPTNVQQALDELITLIGSSPAQIQLFGLNTAAMAASGQYGYVSAPSTVSPTDALAIASSIVLGVYESLPGTMIVGGTVGDAEMTTAGGSPANGAQVYLAASTEEAAAAGKLTAAPYRIGTAVGAFTPAAGNVQARVGICIDNSNYAALKTCVVYFQPTSPIVL